MIPTNNIQTLINKVANSDRTPPNDTEIAGAAFEVLEMVKWGLDSLNRIADSLQGISYGINRGNRNL